MVRDTLWRQPIPCSGRLSVMLPVGRCAVLLCLAALLALCAPAHTRTLAAARELIRWGRDNGATFNVDVVENEPGHFSTVAAFDIEV